MKRLTVRLIAALITFTVGLAAVTLWLAYADAGRARRTESPRQQRARTETPPDAGAHTGSSAPEGMPILSYCELARNSDRYDGQVVRVRATLRMSFHGLFLSDVTCDLYENRAAVDFHAPSRQLVEWKLSDGRGVNLLGPAPVALLAIGRFQKVTPSGKSDSLRDTAPLRFKIMHVEKAVTVEQACKVAR